MSMLYHTVKCNSVGFFRLLSIKKQKKYIIIVINIITHKFTATLKLKHFLPSPSLPFSTIHSLSHKHTHAKHTPHGYTFPCFLIPLLLQFDLTSEHQLFACSILWFNQIFSTFSLGLFPLFLSSSNENAIGMGWKKPSRTTTSKSLNGHYLSFSLAPLLLFTLSPLQNRLNNDNHNNTIEMIYLLVKLISRNKLPNCN